MALAAHSEAGAHACDAATVGIRNVFLHVTSACNLRCVYCYLSAGEPAPDEMSAEDFAQLWPNLVTLSPTKVVLTGGEPLLRPDLLELLRGLCAADPQHRILRCLNTNGCLMTSQFARQLVGLVDEVRVSIDALSGGNDYLRGHGTFEAALAAFESLYFVGFEPVAMITVTRVGLPDLTALITLLAERHITRVHLNPLHGLGRGEGYLKWWVEAEELRAAVREAWEQCWPNRPMPPDPEDLTRPMCGVGSFLNIMPNGDVFPCHVLAVPQFYCGNVRRQSLPEICSQLSLVGGLRWFDRPAGANSDKHLTAVARSGGCVGEIYRSYAHPKSGAS